MLFGIIMIGVLSDIIQYDNTEYWDYILDMGLL